MTLTPGVRLGPYEIVGAIGAGGMGEVYRGRDAALNRDVAIKVLPAAMATEPERLARFKREAQVLASLNHPNIAAIFGMEVGAPLVGALDAGLVGALGEDRERAGTGPAPKGPTVALVMEFVEGEDLSERLKRGAIPVDESIAIAKQIAEGLEEAHEHGIIHRDLKPANVKVTSDGKVKILDFGLAKAIEGDASSSAANSQLSHSPTMSRHMTEAGMIMGTAAYMSPEQARGKPVDKRADIWSFGVVLFEMLAGERLFPGETVSDTLAAVLTRDPNWAALPPATPRPVVQLLRRCLTRDTRLRLRDMGEARLVLGDPASGGEVEAGASTPSTPPGGGRTLIGLSALGVAALASLATYATLRGRLDATSAGASALSLRRLTELPGAELQPSLSPDGRMIVYASAASGNLDLYLLRVDGDRSIPLTADSKADDSQPAFSPDGERIAFRSERDGGGLFVMGASGESVRRVANQGYDPAWSPDGKRLVFSTEPVNDPYSRQQNAQLWTVDALSGTPTLLFEGDAVQPRWSPDGSRIAFWATTTGRRDIWTVGASGGKPVAVTSDEPTDWSPEWSPDGRWLYFSSDRSGSFNLWRVAVDPETGVPGGEPQAVTSGVRGLGYARLSQDGSRMAVMAYDRTYEQSVYQIDPASTRATLLRTLRNPSAHWCDLSPDGSWLACTTSGLIEDIVLIRADGAELRRLTADAFKDRAPSWDFAGDRLLFASTRTGDWGIWSIRADGSDLETVAARGVAAAPKWSPDGRQVITSGDGEGGLLLVDVRGPAPAAVNRRISIPASKGQYVRVGAWSERGDLLAATTSGAAGQVSDLSLLDLTTDSLRKLSAPVAGEWFGTIGGWMPDSRRLVARLAGGAAVIDTNTGEWRIIAPAQARDVLSLSRNGRVLSVEHEVLDSDIWLIELPVSGSSPPR